MADWTDPPYPALTVDKAWTDAKATAAFENIVALAEGADGAPKVQGKALNISIGNLIGTTAIIDLDDCAKLLLTATANQTGTGSSISSSIGYQLSSDNGASWGSTVVLATSDVLGGGGGGTITACAAGSNVVDMTGFNAIRLAGVGTLSGSAIWVEGV